MGRKLILTDNSSVSTDTSLSDCLKSASSRRRVSHATNATALCWLSHPALSRIVLLPSRPGSCNRVHPPFLPPEGQTWTFVSLAQRSQPVCSVSPRPSPRRRCPPC